MHELGHRSSYQCVENCDKRFHLEEGFVAHVKAEHPNLTAPSVLSVLKQASARSAKLSDQANCPLCHQGMTSKAMQKHLGRHQEQLALFVLSPNLDETEVDPNDDDNISVDVKQWQDEEVSSSSDATEF
jgi:hypothetical protein